MNTLLRNIDTGTVDSLMHYLDLQDETSGDPFAGVAQEQLQQFERHATDATNYMEAQQKDFEQNTTSLVERIKEVGSRQFASEELVRLQELSEKQQFLQGIQERLLVGMNVKNEELTKLTTQMAASQISMQKTIEDARRQKNGPDPRFVALSEAITDNIKELIR